MSKWIKWEGGECPVEKGTLVDVKYRDGGINEHVKAMGYWDNDWHNDGEPGDITAYRLHEPDKADIEPLTAQLRKAVAKRDKLADKVKRVVGKLENSASEVQNLSGQLEREIEEITGLRCSIGADKGEWSNEETVNKALSFGDMKHFPCKCHAIPEGVDINDHKTWYFGDVVKRDDGVEFEYRGYSLGDHYIVVSDGNGDEQRYSLDQNKFRLVRRPA